MDTLGDHSWRSPPIVPQGNHTEPRPSARDRKKERLTPRAEQECEAAVPSAIPIGVRLDDYNPLHSTRSFGTGTAVRASPTAPAAGQLSSPVARTDRAVGVVRVS